MGVGSTVDAAKDELAREWNGDDGLLWVQRSPWVVSYSGGKDSTLLLLLVLETALQSGARRPVYVVFSDTGIEQDGIVERVQRNFAGLEALGRREGLEIQTAIITPPIETKFFNYIVGRGYCAPYPPQLRWCTDRLKREPIAKWHRATFGRSTHYTLTGERFDESTNRKENMTKRLDARGFYREFVTIIDKQGRKKRVRLRPKNELMYCPTRNVTSADLWAYLGARAAFPWGESLEELLRQYDATSVQEIIDGQKERRSGCRFCTFGKFAASKDERENAFCRDVKEFFEHDCEARNLIEIRFLNTLYNTPKHTANNARILAGEYAVGRMTLDARKRALEMVRRLEKETGRVWIDDADMEHIRRCWEIDAGRIARGELVDARTVLK